MAVDASFVISCLIATIVYNTGNNGSFSSIVFPYFANFKHRRYLGWN